METRSDSIREPIYYTSASAKSSISGGDQHQLHPPSYLSETGSTRSSGGSGGSSQSLGFDDPHVIGQKIPRKFITNWRQACDKTRDRTKDLFKKWKTVSSGTINIHDGVQGQEFDHSNAEVSGFLSTVSNKDSEQPNWSVHVWTTWVSRYPSNESLSAIDELKNESSNSLAPVQRDKLSHFFTYLFDHDKDGFITKNDLSIFTEKLRRYADWSWNSQEYLRLLEVEEGIAESILRDREARDVVYMGDTKADLEVWLIRWAQIIAPVEKMNYTCLPLWVKVLPRILFLAINTSGNGKISKSELAGFYTSVIGFDVDKIDKCLDIAYVSMTSNGDHHLAWPQYQLVFANFLFGRGPYGPGEHFLGSSDSCIIRGNSIPFPIDFTAMNTPKDRLEVYSPHCKSNRKSVIV